MVNMVNAQSMEALVVLRNLPVASRACYLWEVRVIYGNGRNPASEASLKRLADVDLCGTPASVIMQAMCTQDTFNLTARPKLCTLL